MVALYLFLFAVSSGTVLGYIYWNTAGLLERQTDDTIRAEITGLAEQYGQGGLRRLVQTIDIRSRDAGDSIYLVADFIGRKVSGNLTSLPENLPEGEGWVEFPYAAGSEGAKSHDARAYLFRLRGGFLLLVGRDVHDRRYFTGLIRQTLFWALGLTLALGIAGGFLISRNFLNRIDSISQTSRAIMRGDLSERMAITGTGDELDTLAISLNDMLNQIERLMTGMREVSDNVAHDLRTPLTRIRARLEDGLRQPETLDPRQREVLERTIEEADQLLKTFNALLSIARTEAGEGRSEMASVDVGEILLDLAELYEPIIEHEGGTLKVSATSGLVVHGDRQLISQAVSNLLDNAINHASGQENEPVHIALEGKTADGRVTVSVADNGPGIAVADRIRAMDRFVRLDESRSKPGSGLGLALVRGIAGLHGGMFELLDNNPGLRANLSIPERA